MAYGDKDTYDILDMNRDFGRENQETRQFGEDLYYTKDADTQNKYLDLFNRAYSQLREREAGNRRLRIDDRTGEETVRTYEEPRHMQDSPGYAVNIANTVRHILEGGETDLLTMDDSTNYLTDRYRPYPLEKNMYSKEIPFKAQLSPNAPYDEQVEGLPNIGARRVPGEYSYDQAHTIPSHADSADIRDIVQLIESFKAGETMDFMRDEENMEEMRGFDKEMQGAHAKSYAKEREDWHLGKLLGRERPDDYSAILQDKESGRYYRNPDERGGDRKYGPVGDILRSAADVVGKGAKLIPNPLKSILGHLDNMDEDDFFAPK